MLMAKLCSSLLKNTLAGKANRAEVAGRVSEGIIRAAQDF